MAKKTSAKKPRTINQQLASLEKLVRSGFRQTDARFRQVDKRFGQIDARFRQVDKRFGQIDARFRQVDKQFGLVHLEFRYFRKEMNERFTIMEDRIDRLASHRRGLMKLFSSRLIGIVLSPNLSGSPKIGFVDACSPVDLYSTLRGYGFQPLDFSSSFAFFTKIIS